MCFEETMGHRRSVYMRCDMTVSCLDGSDKIYSHFKQWCQSPPPPAAYSSPPPPFPIPPKEENLLRLVRLLGTKVMAKSLFGKCSPILLKA